MTFVEAFYNFSVTLNDSARNLYTEFRLRVAKHPDEEELDLFVKLLAYCHSYESDLKFSRGLFEPKEPSMWMHDSIGNVLSWIEVGCPDFDKVRRALHSSDLRESKFKVYLATIFEIEKFCGYLKGSKSNWIQPIEFFYFDSSLLEPLLGYNKLKQTLTVNILDDVIFLNREDIDVPVVVEHIDMWEKYQTSISNAV